MSNGKRKTAIPPAASGYRINTGMNYGPENKRAEVGDIVTDLPEESLKWLVKQGHVTPVETAPVEG